MSKNRKSALIAFLLVTFAVALIGSTVSLAFGSGGGGDEPVNYGQQCRVTSDGKTNIIFVTSAYAKANPTIDFNKGCARIDDVKPVILTVIKTPTGKTCVLAQDNNAVHTVKAGDVKLDRFNYTNWYCAKAVGYFAQITAIDFAGNVQKKFV